MLNILSYIGVSLQSELCLWTLLGLIRTIFDATLFKVNANLKQVWQMSMPEPLSIPVQQATRTIISGIMLVQCFTVYVYLASYIVLLYPVFLEERPTLVLPWLLLAAIRSFLCELTSLAVGLGACVLLGAARPPCIKFVVFKVASITPAFYMWMLVYCYYDMLKASSSYKRFPAALAMMPSDHDYGLELAVRRRRTKSLQDEGQLRKKLVASFNYGEGPESSTKPLKSDVTARMVHSTHADFEDIQAELHEPPILTPLPTETKNSDLGAYEDWSGNEIIVPRDSDRILEQFSVMMLRIAAYIISAEGSESAKLISSHSHEKKIKNYVESSSPLRGADADSLPPVITMGKTASYLQNYPQIFMKKTADSVQLPNKSVLNPSQPTKVENIEEISNTTNKHILPQEKVSVEKELKIGVNNYNNTRPSENVTKANLESTAMTETQKTESQLTTRSAISQISQRKDPTASTSSYQTKKNMSSSIRLDDQSKSDSQILRIDKNEELGRIIKLSSEDLTSPPSSKSKIQRTSSNLETIRQRIQINAALLHQKQRQQENENTHNADTTTPTRRI